MTLVRIVFFKRLLSDHWNKAVDASSMLSATISAIIIPITYNVYITLIKNRSAKKILNNSGLNIETSVTPNTIQIFLIFILCFLFNK